MSYFNYMQGIQYSLNPDGTEAQQVRNIFSRSKMITSIMDKIEAYYDYVVQEGDTPEIVAYKFYGDAHKHWLVLFSNFITDPYFDWPMSEYSFDKYMKRKYGSVANSQSEIHHTESTTLFTNSFDSETYKSTQTRFLAAGASQYYYDFSDGTVKERTIPSLGNVDEPLPETFTAPDGTSLVISKKTYSVSSYDYEYYLNESRKNIKLVDPAHATSIEFELKRLMGL